MIYLLYFDKLVYLCSGIIHQKNLCIMKKTSNKVLKTVCIFAIICVIVWVAVFARYAYFVFTEGSGSGVINWSAPQIELRVALFIFRCLLALVIAGLLIAFVKNTLNYLKRGAIFNRKNVKLLWTLAIVFPIYSLLGDNMVYVVSGVDISDWRILLSANTLVGGIVVALVAILYKLAYDAAEEQKLTI